MTNANKISPEQFKAIAKLLPEIRNQKNELADLAKAKPARINEILGEYYSWAEIYELSFIEQLAYLFVLIGLHKPIIEVSVSDSPHHALMKASEDGGAIYQWLDINESSIEKKHLLWIVLVFQRNIFSIMLFHQSLGALVDQVRNGNDEALFKAVSIDRSILSCPTFANRLSLAELKNEKPFFMHLRKALKGPSQKNMAAIGDLRYAIILLREVGFDQFTDDELIKFFVGSGLYPNHPSAAKNLRKHIQAARKFSTT